MITNSSTALITGGTSGIGRAVANKLAALGIHVIVAGRDVERGNLRSSFRTAGYPAMVVFGDSRCPARSRTRSMNRTKRQHYLKARANAMGAAVVGNLNAGGSLTLEG